MKESAYRVTTTATACTKQGSTMTSSSSTSRQQRVLTRSHSLASPLNDATLTLSSGAVLPEPSGAAASGKKGTRGAGEGGAQGGARKPLRRQRSLAELFGVVLYKSKVQLQELFWRRDTTRGNKRHDASPLATQTGRVGVTTDDGGSLQSSSSSPQSPCDVEVVVTVTPERRSAAPAPPRLRQQPVTRGPVAKHGSHPDLSRDEEGGQRRSRTPEELFCVASSPSARHHHHPPPPRPVSSRSLDTLRGDLALGSSPRSQTPPSPPLPPGSSSPSGVEDRLLLKPERCCRAKSTLVKSNSDSLCRLSPHPHPHPPGDPRQSTVTKASSDDAVFFVRRTPSPQLRQHQPHLHPDPTTNDILLPLHLLHANNDDDTTTITATTSSRVGSGARRDVVDRVADWLLVGGVEAAYNEPLLCSLGVGAIVDLTNLDPHLVPPEKKISCPCTCGKSHFRAKLHVALDDIEWEDIQQCFPEANAFINGWRQRGRRVLVVSYHGKSRAPAVVVQYLMTYFRLPLQRALHHVRSRRPQTRINPGFMRALQRLDKRLWEEDSSSSLIPASSLPEDLQSDFDSAIRCPKTAWDEC